jgi:hypothetical protein
MPHFPANRRLRAFWGCSPGTIRDSSFRCLSWIASSPRYAVTPNPRPMGGAARTRPTRWRTSRWRLSLRSLCKARPSWRSSGLNELRLLGGQLPIALDGTEYRCSQEICCPNCSHRKRGKGQTEYLHTMLAAKVGAPGHNRAVPLEPEFIVPRDGHEKQDCESRAARRWLAAYGAKYAKLKAVCLGEDLFSRQPICEAVLEQGLHFMFVSKPDSHPAIEEFRSGVELDTLTERHRRDRPRPPTGISGCAVCRCAATPGPWTSTGSASRPATPREKPHTAAASSHTCQSVQTMSWQRSPPDGHAGRSRTRRSTP